MMKSDSLGKRIVLARIKADMNQKDLAGRLKISASALSLFESNDRIPRVDVVQAICRETGTTPNEILGDCQDANS